MSLRPHSVLPQITAEVNGNRRRGVPNRIPRCFRPARKDLSPPPAFQRHGSPAALGNADAVSLLCDRAYSSIALYVSSLRSTAST